MINWRFILNPDSDNIEIEEPAGWSDTEIALLRDRVYHGVSVAFSEKSLELQGQAAIFVKEQYELYGADAEVILRIFLECEDAEDDAFQEDFSLDFKTYAEHCGIDCRVTIGFSELGCFKQFVNNFEKKVSLDSTVTFNGSTPVTAMSQLKQEITLPGVPIKVRDRAEAPEEITDIISNHPDWECNGCTNDGFNSYILPALPEVKFSALGLFNPSATIEFIRYYGANNIPPWEVDMTVNAEELLSDVRCDLANGRAQFQAKGHVDIAVSGAGNPGVLLRLKLFRLPAGGDITDQADWVEEYSQDLIDTRPSGSGQFTFNESGDVALTLQQGDLLHYGIFLIVSRISQISSFSVTQSAGENYFDLSADMVCPDTAANLFMIHETLARIAEVIGDQCLQLESEYYGRMDSQPTAYAEDGCGGLRALTSGLYIRRAENPAFFLSMKEAIDGLRGIDNIGFALIKDSGGDVLKVEPVRWFYSDQEVMRCPYVASVKKAVSIADLISIIKLGFEKWQPEAINGLDEFNSTREYRLDIREGDQTLDIMSRFIAATYLWEQTRQQSFAETGAADTAFDNDTFILCLMRDAYNALLVEQGNITTPANISYPDDVYNFRISPVRSLLKWFKSLAGVYRDHTTREIVFSAGTGNFIAEGLVDDDCALEDTVITEQQNIHHTDFKQEEDSDPIIRPEIITFEYPMSLADFKAVRANPYGFISYQCGTGDWYKGYISSLKYKPANGIASFDLRMKYE